MFVVWLNVIMAGLIGFFLYLYLFVTRSRMANPWRWMAGIGVGLIVGIFMMLVDFLIIMPPADTIITIVGFALIAAVFTVTLWVTKKQNKLDETYSENRGV